ncbi:MAG TPA: sugar phosphate isomerase/epimerase [Gemmatimonadaceae bacterium]|nr:sugar phosphate isomerase/epimerase [Gemmatimonadaceae bacterium]
MKKPILDTDMTRRGFVGAVGGLLASSTLPAESAANTAAGKKLSRIGLQLYTVRDEMQKNFARTLARVARIGYKEVEFAGYFGNSPRTVRNLLRQYGLTSPASHVGFPVLGKEWDKTIEDALVIGNRYVICPWIDEKQRTLDGYKQVAELFNKAGERAKSAGLQFGYHNHDFEFKKLQGRLAYDLLLEETDPKLVVMELDVFWITNGGHDALAYFTRYPGRFPLLHIKDRDAAGKMVDVGKGAIPWRAVLARRGIAGTKHIFVEHDQPGDAFAFISNSYRYLRTLDA